VSSWAYGGYSCYIAKMRKLQLGYQIDYNVLMSTIY